MTITREQIEAKLQTTSKEFDRIQGEIKKIEHQEQGLSQKKAELNVELFRLQGDNRTLTDLKKAFETPDAPQEPATSA